MQNYQRTDAGVISDRRLNFLAWISRSSVILTLVLLSAGVSMAQSPKSPEPKPSTPTKTISPKERLELEQLRQQQLLQEQVQAEAQRTFKQTMTLFNLLLGLLGILLAATLVGLWLLRRSVVREVTVIVKNHLNELGDLEGKIAVANQQMQAVIRETDKIAQDLNAEADDFQDELGTNRDQIGEWLTELSQVRQGALQNFQQETQEVTQEINRLEIEFSKQLADLQNRASNQQDLILQNLDKLGTNYANHVAGLQADVDGQKIRF